MTDSQFSELMKMLRSIDKHVEDIWKQMPDSLGPTLMGLHGKLEEIKNSVDLVEFAIGNKE